jgi:hypothetical protein
LIDSNHRLEGLAAKNLMKPQEQYSKAGGKKASTAPAGPENVSMNPNDACDNDFSANGDLDDPAPSPLFTPSTVTPPEHARKAGLVHPVDPPPYLKNLVELLEDDDVEVVPMKRKRASSISGPVDGPLSLVDSVKGKGNPPRLNLKGSMLAVQKKGQPSKAKTRIKKRKISQELVPLEIESGDEEKQPPLKRVKLRKKGPATKNNNVSSGSVKPRSVITISPDRTPVKRLPRNATVVWPKIDRPVFDQVCKKRFYFHLACSISII